MFVVKNFDSNALLANPQNSDLIDFKYIAKIQRMKLYFDGLCMQFLVAKLI